MGEQVLVQFIQCTQAQYDSIKAGSGTNQGTLYYTSDTRRVFKGDTEYTKSALFVSTFSGVSGSFGTVYIRTDEGKPYVFNGTEFVPIVDFTASNPGINSTTGTAANADKVVPTTKAVYNYGESLRAYTDSEVADVLAEVEEELDGVVCEPTYEQSTRTITLPMKRPSGSTDPTELVINLGKDMVIESGEYDSATKTIYLYLVGHSEEPDDPNLIIEVPVDDLVDEYDFEAGNAGVGISVDTTQSPIQVTISANVSTDSTNTLKIGNDGMYVKISTDADNIIAVGNDGGLYVPDSVIYWNIL